MITLTSFERQLRAHLLALARDYRLNQENPAGITYRDLGVLADPAGERASGPQPNTRPPFRGLNEALGHISMYEVEHGRPMLSALVVNSETGKPGEGFARLAEHLGIDVGDSEMFWRAELADAVEFWSSLANDPTRVVDAAVDSLYDEIRALREQVQRSGRRLTSIVARRRSAPAAPAVGAPASRFGKGGPDEGGDDRLSARARRTLQLAEEEARLLRHDSVGTEDLLLGLIHEGGDVAEALQDLGISLTAVREVVERRTHTTHRAPRSYSNESVPFSPRAKKILASSWEEALAQGRREIGTEHLLLGILREEEDAAVMALPDLGADVTRVREAMMDIARREE